MKRKVKARQPHTKSSHTHHYLHTTHTRRQYADRTRRRIRGRALINGTRAKIKCSWCRVHRTCCGAHVVRVCVFVAARCCVLYCVDDERSASANFGWRRWPRRRRRPLFGGRLGSFQCVRACVCACVCECVYELIYFRFHGHEARALREIESIYMYVHDVCWVLVV